MLGSASLTTAKLVSGCVFTFIALFVISAINKTADKEEKVAMVANNHLLDDDAEPTEKVEAIAEEGKPVQTAEDQHVFPITGATIAFQGLMFLAAMYYSMLLTNWGYPAASDTTATFFKGSTEASYWF